VRSKYLPLLAIPLILVVLFYPVTVSSNSGLNGRVVETLSLTVVHHTVSTQLNRDIVSSGWNASCASGSGVNGHCSAGWTYTLDPTVHVMNQGLDCMTYKIFGVSHAGSNAPCIVSEDNVDQNVTYTYVSVSSGYTPLFTDATCHATIQTSDGYSVANVSPVAGTPSAGSQTDTITQTWTDATAQVASIDLACIGWSATTTGSLYAAGQIGTTTTNIGDTLETIWSIIYASS
jgi:hypothetical protein